MNTKPFQKAWWAALVLAGLLLSPLALAADAGADPAFKAALAAYSGVGGQVDMDKAHQLFQEAADQGNPLAILWVARCLQGGRAGFALDPEKAGALAAPVLAPVRELAESDSRAMFLMGSACQDGLGMDRDEAAARQWYEKSALMGDTLAMGNLGWMFHHGRGGPRDLEAARQWYGKAAEAGDAAGMMNLGFLYEKGLGVDRDEAQAVRWYSEAAERGHPKGMFNLGWMLENGRGTDTDERRAVDWYFMAANKGEP
ncbi:MAG: tetratricopeptide repeat protein, partial [Pseudomonadota bacterium]